MRYRNQRPVCLLFCPTENPKIICVSDDIHFFQSCIPHCPVRMTLYRTARCIFSMGIVLRYRIALPLAFNPMVEFIQNYVCQQWGNNSALRRSLCWVFCMTVRHEYWCFENPADYIEQFFISDIRRP